MGALNYKPLDNLCVFVIILSRGVSMKKISLVILILAVLVLGGLFVGVKVEVNDLNLQLEVAKAEAATGQCGNQFLVVLSDGRVAVAGRVMDPSEAEVYYFNPTPHGGEVWKKDPSIPGSSSSAAERGTLEFRRVPKTGCPQ